MALSLPNARPRFDPNRPKGSSRKRQTGGVRDDMILFGISFVLLMIAAVFFFFVLDVFNQDSLSRTLDAHNVLSSRDPHLGAIGLAWPPIPTFLRIVIMPVLAPFGLTEFTGPITSVFGAAGCVVLTNRILKSFGLTGAVRGVWIGLSVANPVLLYHFVNGTAESLFAFFFLFVILAALQLRAHPERAVLGMGFGAGMALWVRYEAVAIMAMCIAGYLLMAYMYRRETAWKDITRFESLLVTLVFPSAFLLALWFSFNWTAQGDPLFFYRGPYSINAAPDVAKNATDHALAFAYHNVLGTIQYVTERTFQTSLLFPVAAVAAAFIGLKKRMLTGTVLALITVSTVMMQAYQTYTGTIAPWLRYWVYLPLFAPILLGWIASAYPIWLRGTSMAHTVRMFVIPGLILLGNVIAFQTMTHHEVGADEQLVVEELLGSPERIADLRSFYPDRDVLREIADYLDTTEGVVMVDVQKAAVLIIDFDEPQRLAINTDRDFDSLLSEPVGRVSYFLLPNPRGKGVELARDAIYTRFPDLYEGAAWLALDREFDGAVLDWRLYRVIDPLTEPPQIPTPTATPATTPATSAP
jgi:hypothetical protein